MHDPKLLAILDRREPVTLAWLTRYTYPNIIDRQTGAPFTHEHQHTLGGEVSSLPYAAEAFVGWPAWFAWNLTIAMLLNVAARRALYQTNVLGGM